MDGFGETLLGESNRRFDEVDSFSAFGVKNFGFRLIQLQMTHNPKSKKKTEKTETLKIESKRESESVSE